MATTRKTSPDGRAALRGETLPKEEAHAAVIDEQNSLLINDKAYFEVLNSIKKQIRDAQYRAVLGGRQPAADFSLLEHRQDHLGKC
ncbi:MAG: hypothetical protein LBR51_01550 [Bacteroidales bacterium]|jgi:hypothetical protein|nr:hypothetical protein [Bacteroidales bacterium]